MLQPNVDWKGKAWILDKNKLIQTVWKIFLIFNIDRKYALYEDRLKNIEHKIQKK